MAKRRKKILIIAPHADDEVLGCGGYLLQQSRECAEIHIIFGTIGGADKRQDFSVRLSEAKAVSENLKANLVYLYSNKDALLDTIPSRDIITRLDKEIDEVRPDEIFINYRSHHQDHIKMYDCAMASIRLREGYMPQLVALYEYPFITESADSINGGKMYCNISDVIDEKVALFNLYASQVRQSPSPLNEMGIRSLASVRGMECGVEYAEKFYVQKMIL